MMETLQFIERVGIPSVLALGILWRVEGRLDMIYKAILGLTLAITHAHTDARARSTKGG